MPLSVTGQSDLRIGAWLAASQSDESGMKSEMKTDSNRRALILLRFYLIFLFYRIKPQLSDNIFDSRCCMMISKYLFDR